MEQVSFCGCEPEGEDDQILFAPVVQEQVTGGRVRITLGAGRPRPELIAECHSLAATLRSGVLQGAWTVTEIRPR